MKMTITLLSVVLLTCACGGNQSIQPGERIEINTTKVENTNWYWAPDKKVYKINLDECNTQVSKFTFILDLVDSTYSDALLGDFDLRECEFGITENNMFGIYPKGFENLLIEITRDKIIHTRISEAKINGLSFSEGKKAIREYKTY